MTEDELIQCATEMLSACRNYAVAQTGIAMVELGMVPREEVADCFDASKEAERAFLDAFKRLHESIHENASTRNCD